MHAEFKAQFRKDYGPSWRQSQPDYSRCAVMVEGACPEIEDQATADVLLEIANV